MDQEPWKTAFDRLSSQYEMLDRLANPNNNSGSELFGTRNPSADTSELDLHSLLLESEVNNKQNSDTNSTVVGPNTYPRSSPGLQDNLVFDMSEFFDFDAAAAPNDSSDNQGNPVLSGHTSDGVLPSNEPQNIYSPSVSFSEFLKKRQVDALLKSFEAEKRAPGRGQQMKPVRVSSQGAAPHMLGSSKKDVNNFKNDFLPVMSDPLYEAEFAAFAASGIKSKKTQSPPAKKDDDEYVKAGQIYVSYLIRKKIKLSGKLTTVSQEYTNKEIDWATKVLSPESKRWLKDNCGLDEIESDWQSMIVEDERAAEQKENASVHVNSTKLLPTGNGKDADNKMQGLNYPDRMRLFSEELNRSLPPTSGRVEGFEDLPAGKDDKEISTVQFSFINGPTYATAIERLEAILTNNPTSGPQELKVLPQLSALPSQLTGTYMFNVTAPKHVSLVTTLQEFFPEMDIKKIGGQTIFMEKVVEN